MSSSEGILELLDLNLPQNYDDISNYLKHKKEEEKGDSEDSTEDSSSEASEDSSSDLENEKD